MSNSNSSLATDSPINKLFGWIRQTDGHALMRFSAKFQMDREELAECIVWHSMLMLDVYDYGDGAKLAEPLPLTAKGARKAAEELVWRNGHPGANCRDLCSDEEAAIAVVSRRLAEMGVA